MGLPAVRSVRPALWVAGVLLGALLALVLGGGWWPPDRAGAQQSHRGPVFSADETRHRAVAENAPIGTSVGVPFSAVDPDGETVTYSLQDGTTAFSINAATGQLSTREALDFETRVSYIITVNARDPNGHGQSRTMTVRVTDVDEAPSITRSAPAGLATADSTSVTTGAGASSVAAFTASDPEGGAVTWSLSGADAAQFSINSAGALSFAVAPDYNAPADTGADNVYDVTVDAADGAGNSSQHPVTVTVQGLSGPTMVVREEGGDPTVGLFEATDVSLTRTETAQWTLGGTDGADFRFKPCHDARSHPSCTGKPAFTAGLLLFRAAPDFSSPKDADRDNTYSLTLIFEGGGESRSTAVTVKVHDLGGAPTATYNGLGATTLSVEEGHRSEWTFMIRDPDRRSLSVVLAGEDAEDFNIEDFGFGNQWSLTPKSTPDFESPADSDQDNTYNLLLKVHNGTNTIIHPITVDITDAAERPVIHGPKSVKFEVGGAGTVAAFTASDGDGTPITFSSRGPNGSLFNVSSTGELTYKTAPTVEATHTVRVRVDSGGRHAHQLLTVKVVAAGTNQAPGAVGGPAAKNFPESGGNVYVASYTSTDPDGDTIFWSLSGADAALFDMGHNGWLNWLRLPDFDSPGDTDGDNVYHVNVTASDGIASVTKAVEVTVTDANEPPTVTGRQTVSRAGGSNRSVATYTAADPENSPTITWTLTGKDAGDFTINSSGALSFGFDPDPASPQDAEGDNVYHVVVKASDGTNFDTLPVEVTITGGTGAAPTVTAGPTAKSHPENSTAAIGTYTATDADGDRITWTLAGDDAARFTINAAGELSFRAAPDFESKLDADTDNVYDVTVTASDGTASGTRAVAVTVTNVDEAPVVTGPTVVTKASRGGTDVGTYAATDPEGATGASFFVSGLDWDKFAIDSNGLLSFKTSPVVGFTWDANRDRIFDVTVVATVGNKAGTLRVLIPLHDRNQAPTIDPGGATITVAENSTDALHDYDATDPEGRSVHWDLSGDDADDFRIDISGRLFFSSPPDFEDPADAGGDNVYNVRVVAVDVTHRVTRDVTVTVTGIDEAPEIAGLAAVSFDENGTGVVTTYTADDPEGDTVAWSLSGADHSSFSITNGELSFNNPPDFETKDRYSVTVVATAGGKTDRIDVSVHVQNVNEPPTISGPGNLSVQENTFELDLHTYDAIDPDDFSLAWSLSGADGSSFSITDGRLTLNASPDFEAQESYSVTVEVTDAGSLTGSLAVTVTVTNVDEPGSVTLSASRPVVGTAVTASVSDPDLNVRGESWQWSRVDGQTVTVISGATSESYTPVAADASNRLRVTATYWDGHGSGKSASVTSGRVSERPNNAPVFPSGTQSYTVAEDVAVAGYAFSPVITATDADTGDTLTYSLSGGTAAWFEIDSGTGQLSTAGPLSFELFSGIYPVVITATDASGATGTLHVTITVTDVEEAGTVTLSTDTPRVGTAVTATLSDDDGGVSGQSWVWSADGTAISGATSASYTPVAGDAGKTLSVSVTYTDRRGSGKTASAEAANAVSAEANDPPVLNCPTTDPSVAEDGGTAVATYTATDPEGGTITWSLEGPDQGDFTINSSGALRFTSVPDFEAPADSNTDNVYRVTVVASDGTNQVSCGVTVRVVNVDETGSLSFPTQASPRVGAALTATLTDPDGVRSASWRWSRVGGGTLSSAGSTTTSTYTPVAGDQNHQLNVRVTYTDGHGSGKTLELTTDIVGERRNNAPHFPANTDNTRTVAENTPANRSLGAAFTATDPDGDTLTYTLTGTDAASFTINAATGRLSTNAPLDHETAPTLSVTITATDPGSLSHSVDVTITVTDVDEPPEIVGEAEHDYAEDSTDLDANYTATDPEGGTATLSLSGTDAADFEISAGGDLTFASQPDFEAPADSNRDNRYHVTVRALDGQSNASTLDVTVTVTNVDEDGSITFSNVQPQVTIPLTATLTDPDGRVTGVTWQWSAGGSEIDGATRSSYTPRVEDIDLRLSVTASYTDQHGGGKMVTAEADNPVIAAPPEPFPPVFPDEESGRREIEENTPAGQPIGNPVAATDANEGETELLVYTLDSTGERFFAIDSTTGQLSTKAELDYEQRRGYRVPVTATDPQDTSDTITVRISVIDVDEPPEVEFSRGSAAEEWAENRAGPVVRVRATDPENEKVSMELSGPDERLFLLAAGMVRFKEPPDYENPQDTGGDNVYEVTIVATEEDDDDPQTTELEARQNIEITVTDVNEPPVPGPAPGSETEVTVDEGQEGPVGTYVANDPEDFAIAWSLAGSDASHFTVSADGVLEFKEPPDYESRRGSAGRNRNIYRVTLRAYDGANTATLVVTVTVDNVREDATITFSNRQPQVGSPLTATLDAPDARSSVTWEWEGDASVGAGGGAGSPAGRYTLSIAPTGASAVDWAHAAAYYLQRSSNSPGYVPVEGDRGKNLRVTARYTDSMGRSRTVSESPFQFVRPTPPQNNPPAFVHTELDFTVPENEPAGVPIGTPVSATDTDEFRDGSFTHRDQAFLTYSLDAAGAAVFDIDPATGQLSTKAPLDHETRSSYRVIVTVADPSLATDTATVTITVTNENENPVVTGHEVVFHKSGNTGPVTTFRATDPEKGAITWSLSDDDADDFDLDDGVLRFKDPPNHAAPTDADTDNRYQITVTASDPEVNSASLEVTVAVTSTTVRRSGGGGSPIGGSAGAPGGGSPGGGSPGGGSPGGGSPGGGPGGGGPSGGGGAGPAAPARFVDVDARNVHAASIDALRAAGITAGCSSAPLRFCPDRAVTRAEMATFLVRALNLPAAAPAGYTDVGARSVHTANIDALRAAGITAGCSSAPLRFCPDRAVTRAEMATFLARALKLPRAIPAGFTDVDARSVHTPSIDALYEAGVTAGCSSSPLRFCPRQAVTRAEMATFLIRALNRPEDSN